MQSILRLSVAASVAAVLGLGGSLAAAVESPSISFPESRPEGGSFSRPGPDAQLEISPPGFCWWRAAPRGQVRYRLQVRTEAGASVYASPLLADPAHVPDPVFPAGRYTWTVEACNDEGEVLDTQDPRSFTIQPGACALPWVAPRELLARVAREHPRLLFPKAKLDEIRASLGTTRKGAFESLRREADRRLSLQVPAEPTYDQIPDPAQRRLAYTASFREMRGYHQGGMQPLALMYLLTQEEKYGQRAKAILLGAAQWDPEGVSSVMGRYGDEIGLGLARSAALTYDWIYDLLSEPERRRVERMLVARADQMLRRLERRDFLSRPESSHDGRLPGYLLEHAIAVAEEPRAEVWMDYALRAIMTVFPHWAGRDGGWAEGLSYGRAYNTIFITPFESFRIATGMDLWKRPFYGKLPYFFMYTVSPRGEIMGFGDSYDHAVSGGASGLRGLVQFHAERMGDPVLRWWVDLLSESDGRLAPPPALPGLILPERVRPAPPRDLPRDAAFFGVGWAALHSELTRPDKDLLVAFKSSPFGPVSHSHADQNSFEILQGGKVLARPGGTRYPQHGSPFHTRYTQQTIAHNSILVDGHGQINRRAASGGKLVDFQTSRSFGYVCGDASDAYGDRMERFRRHVLLLRPSVICIVDDLAAPRDSQFQWLMHAFDKLELNEDQQTFVSRRDGAAMTVQLITPGGLAFSQTNQWPLDPKTGFPTARSADPDPLWHFTAATRQRTDRRRIAAIMTVSDSGAAPDCVVRRTSAESLEVTARTADGTSVVRIDLSAQRPGERPILQVRCQINGSAPEEFSAR